MPRIRLASVVVAAFALAACGKDATSPSSQLQAGEAQSLALSMAASGDAYSSAVPAPSVVPLGASATTSTISVTYTAARPCPKGGTVTPSATINGTVDPQARSMTLDLTGTETRADCAYQVQTNTVTVNGSLDITAHVNVLAGVPSGAQTFTEKGSFDWTSSDGRSGTCAVDLSSSADFSTMVRTVHATFCGRTLDFTGPLH